MRIYDGKTPQGRKVDKLGDDYCPECEGREGRHCLVTVTVRRTKANGQRQRVKTLVECPNDQGEGGIDDN
jgi:hypothetical protein